MAALQVIGSGSGTVVDVVLVGAGAGVVEGATTSGARVVVTEATVSAEAGSRPPQADNSSGPNANKVSQWRFTCMSVLPGVD